MSAESPRRNIRGVPAIVPPQIVSDRSIIDSVAGFINDVTLANQPLTDPKDTITWARFESAADISDPRFGDDWELEGNVAPPLLLILGYGLGVQVWAIPANGEAVEVLSWRHGIVSALRVLPTPISSQTGGAADEPADAFADKRPLVAICEGVSSAGCQPQFCAVNFVSLKTGSQVKTIKFKNPVLDILANRTSVVVTFHERIAIFDARTLDDRLTVTTCFPSPGINPNPVALGARWLAYSENKVINCKRSGGGCDGDGVASYTATVLNAAKSLGKGLRELGEQVAAGLTGTSGSGTTSKNTSFDSVTGDIRQPGVVTILDIKYAIKDVSPTSGTPVSINGNDPIVAHFIAHSDAIVAMEFDNTGMMLLTADKRGHDFHVFRIQPHPVGATLASVHHLYVLHRGDTSAKVQNIAFSLDSRWVAVSTLRGTTHVFPITPYGGPAGVRTHTSLHVVNKLSRFHRSAGLTADGRSSSPISHSDSTNFSQLLMPYHNPTLPPFPRPTVVLPLAQLRQPFVLGSPPGSATANTYPKGTTRDRQRLSSLSDDNGKPLSVCAIFAKSRSWLLDPPNATREGLSHKIQRKPVDSLFVMAGHGALIQYDLDTKLASNVAKEKICDDTPIELDVEARAQWNLGRKDASVEITPPLSFDSWLIKDRNACMLTDSTRQLEDTDDRNDSWLSQVEIITHAGPHRRLWMGPQVVFKTYNTPSGSSLSHIDMEAVEIGVSGSASCRPGRSSPLNMPATSGNRSAVPVLIESGSYSSIEQSPKLMNRFRHDHMDSDYGVAHGESRLKEDLADAMRESPSVSHKDTGLTPAQKRNYPSTSVSGSSSSSSSKYESLGKVVNPLGTVTTVSNASCELDPDPNSPYGHFTEDDYVIHENCDESLFRPVVAIFCDEQTLSREVHISEEYAQPPEPIGNKLIVPVIEKSVDLELSKKGSRLLTKEVKNCEELPEEVTTTILVSKKSKKKSGKVLPPPTTKQDITTTDIVVKKKGSREEESTSKTWKSEEREINLEGNLKKEESTWKNRKSEEREMNIEGNLKVKIEKKEDPTLKSRKSEEREINLKTKIEKKKNVVTVEPDMASDKVVILSVLKNDQIQVEPSETISEVKNVEFKISNNKKSMKLKKSVETLEENTITITAVPEEMDLQPVTTSSKIEDFPMLEVSKKVKSKKVKSTILSEVVNNDAVEAFPQLVGGKVKKGRSSRKTSIDNTTVIKDEFINAGGDREEIKSETEKLEFMDSYVNEQPEVIATDKQIELEFADISQTLGNLKLKTIKKGIKVEDVTKSKEVLEFFDKFVQEGAEKIPIEDEIETKMDKKKKNNSKKNFISKEILFKEPEMVIGDIADLTESLKETVEIESLKEANQNEQIEKKKIVKDICLTDKYNKITKKSLLPEPEMVIGDISDLTESLKETVEMLDNKKLPNFSESLKKGNKSKKIEKSLLNEPEKFFVDFPSLKDNVPQMVVGDISDITLNETIPDERKKFDKNTNSQFSNITKKDENKKKEKKSKMSFESLSSFKDLPVLEPLEPFDSNIDIKVGNMSDLEILEPFDSNFDNEVGNQSDQDSLINFESPVLDGNESRRGFPENNIIFALCGSLHYENEIQIESPQLACDDHPDTDEPYLSLEPRFEETPASSEETEGSSMAPPLGKKNKQHRRKKQITSDQEDDEELRPLISEEPNSSSSMTASQLLDPMTTSSSPSSVTAIIRTPDTLPPPTLENNNRVSISSSSSSSDQVNSSEEPEAAAVHVVEATGEPDVVQPLPLAAPPVPQYQPANISKKKSKRRKNSEIANHIIASDSSSNNPQIGGIQASSIDGEELSSSSVSSASRVSLDPPSSSPTTSITGDNLMHFPGDSSNSL